MTNRAPETPPCTCGRGDCPEHDDDKQSVIYIDDLEAGTPRKEEA